MKKIGVSSVINAPRESSPFDWMAVDIKGSLSTTKTWNKCILGGGDYFTKWKETFRTGLQGCVFDNNKGTLQTQ